MADRDVASFRLELAGQILGGGDRPVPPPRTPQRDGEVCPPLLQIEGKRETEKIPESIQIGSGGWVLEEELRNAGVTSRQRSQFLVEMRIGEAAEIEDEVGLGRDTVAISEGDQGDRQ